MRPASAEDVRVWCQVCDVPQQRTEELLAEQRSMAGMWVTYQRLNRAGLRQAQVSVRPIYERSSLIRAYQSRTFPGLLQTRSFTRSRLEQVRTREGVQVDDVAAAVEERMDRQRVLREGNRRFVFLLEEAVLHYRLVDPAAHVEQLGHLYEVMSIPSVSLGVIPLAADRRRPRPVEGFVIFGDEQVSVELVSGYLKITQPREVEMYVREFTALASVAAYGRGARALIAAAREALNP